MRKTRKACPGRLKLRYTPSWMADAYCFAPSTGGVDHHDGSSDPKSWQRRDSSGTFLDVSAAEVSGVRAN